jgi:hypothetical protein
MVSVSSGTAEELRMGKLEVDLSSRNNKRCWDKRETEADGRPPPLAAGGLSETVVSAVDISTSSEAAELLLPRTFVHCERGETVSDIEAARGGVWYSPTSLIAPRLMLRLFLLFSEFLARNPPPSRLLGRICTMFFFFFFVL